MSYPWIPDERGNKMEIPKELYEEIRKIIRNKEGSQKSQDKSQFKYQDKIIYQTTTQRDVNQFFHITK